LGTGWGSGLKSKKGVYTENPTLPIEKWRLDYNEFRPHSSFDDLTPRQFVDKYKSSLEAEKLHFWPDCFSGMRSLLRFA
jgi:hypothetical protein